MLALDFLGMLFAWAMHFGVQMPGVGAPMIRRKAGEPEGLQQRFQSEKDLICAAPKTIRQDGACLMINGMPQPALVTFCADKTPHLIPLGFPSSLNGDRHLLGVYGAKQSRVH